MSHKIANKKFLTYINIWFKTHVHSASTQTVLLFGSILSLKSPAYADKEKK